MDTTSQFDLFGAERAVDHGQEAAARARMAATIGRLRALRAPPWRDEAAVILEDGAFRRAMRLVPEAEAGTLWAAFDKEMDRLYALWTAGRGT